MLKEWLKMWRARSWMKRNEGFLPTWHAYVGYKLKLFAQFADGRTVEQIAAQTGMDRTLLESWTEVGLAVKHLRYKHAVAGIIVPSREMSTYFQSESEQSVGELLVEMMELHLPALLSYPKMMTAGERRTFAEDEYAGTVAATSSYIERVAYPVLNKWVKRQRCRTILDVGCGYAGYLMRLARSNSTLQLFGIEKDSHVLKAAREQATRAHLNSVHLLQADFLQAESLPLEQASNRFDMVMMNNILYYFAPERRSDLMRRATDLLAPGGSLTIISPLRSAYAVQPFAAAFNTFMRAHENLFDLPSIAEIAECGRQSGLELTSVEPLIKEGSWYFCGLRKM